MKNLLVLATAAAVLLIAPAAQASMPCDGGFRFRRRVF
jgi:hypothetical protein